MADLEVELKDLQHLIQQMLKQQQRLQKENNALKDSVDEKDKLLSKKSESFNQLQQQLEASRLGLSGLSPADKQYLQKRIDTYLADIEKCIAAINL